MYVPWPRGIGPPNKSLVGPESRRSERMIESPSDKEKSSNTRRSDENCSIVNSPPPKRFPAHNGFPKSEVMLRGIEAESFWRVVRRFCRRLLLRERQGLRR